MAQSLDARLNSYWPTALSVFRVMFGLLFLSHGLSGLVGWPAADHVPPVGQWPDYYASWIEAVTGALITLGLFTRPAAFLASGEMAFAYFTVHLPHGFFPINNHGEDAVMFCFAFLLLIFAGGGPYASDAHRSRWPGRSGWSSRRSRLRLGTSQHRMGGGVPATGGL